MAPARAGFSLRRDHGFRNPPVQPPIPFPGAWDRGSVPPWSWRGSHEDHPDAAALAFQFHPIPEEPWRPHGPHLRQQYRYPHAPVEVAVGAGVVRKDSSNIYGALRHNNRGGSETHGAGGARGVTGGKAERYFLVEAAPAVLLPVGGVLPGPQLPVPYSNSASPGGGTRNVFHAAARLSIADADASAHGSVLSDEVDQGVGSERRIGGHVAESAISTDVAAATDTTDTDAHATPAVYLKSAERTASGDTSPATVTLSSGGGDELTEESLDVEASPAAEVIQQSDRCDKKGGATLLMARGDGAEEEKDEREAEEEDDPEMEWEMSKEWQDHLRKSPSVQRYLQRMQAKISTWKNGRGRKKRNKKAITGSGGADGPIGDGGTVSSGNNPSGGKNSKPSPSPSNHDEQLQQEQRPEAPGGKGDSKKKRRKKKKKKDKTSKKKEGPREVFPDSDEGSVAAKGEAQEQELELELAKMKARALLYAEQQQGRPLEDAVLEAAPMN